MRTRSIAIAGCGVAGLATALLLRLQGANVVIFDKLSTPQPLGSGLILQPVGLHVLDALGVGEEVRALGALIDHLYGKSGDRVVLDVRYGALGPGAAIGLGIHRGALFDVLYRAAMNAGVKIESGCDVVDAGGGHLTFASGAQSPRFELIIDALGARSPLSRAPWRKLPFGALWTSLPWIDGFDARALEQRYEAARKMVGVMPIGRLPGRSQQLGAFFWSLKHADLAAWLDAPLSLWKQDVLALWPNTAPLLDQVTSHKDLVFATYGHRTLHTPLARDWVHVGDSWHCTSPQLGQGANMALLDAYALARALASQPDLTIALGEYERLRLWHIRLYQAASWAFTPAYQSDSALFAMLRDRIMGPLSRIPPAPAALAALVAGQWGSPLDPIRRIDLSGA